jgi:hypothetical protein
VSQSDFDKLITEIDSIGQVEPELYVNLIEEIGGLLDGRSQSNITNVHNSQTASTSSKLPSFATGSPTGHTYQQGKGQGFKVVDQWSVENPKFKRSRFATSITLDKVPDNLSIEDTSNWLRGVFDNIINYLKNAKHNPYDVVGLEIYSKVESDAPINLSYRRRLKRLFNPMLVF